jgi:hypothetical protein
VFVVERAPPNAALPTASPGFCPPAFDPSRPASFVPCPGASDEASPFFPPNKPIFTPPDEKSPASRELIVRPAYGRCRDPDTLRIGAPGDKKRDGNRRLREISSECAKAPLELGTIRPGLIGRVGAFRTAQGDGLMSESQMDLFGRSIAIRRSRLASISMWCLSRLIPVARFRSLVAVR